MSAFEDTVHRVYHLVEAASSTTLLRDSNDAELVASAMFNDRHDLNSERDLLHIEI